MFVEKPGRKIKNYAVVMFLLDAVLVSIGFVFGLIATVREGGGFLSALFWGALVGAPLLLSIYLISLVLYAVGDMAEETTRQTELFEQNNELLSQLLEQKRGASSDAPAPAPVPEAAPAPDPVPAPAPAPVVAVSTRPSRSYATVRCPKCGTSQGDAREKCYNCGAPLKSE